MVCLDRSLPEKQLESYLLDGFVGPLTACHPDDMRPYVDAVTRQLGDIVGHSSRPSFLTRLASPFTKDKLRERLGAFKSNRHFNWPSIEQLCTNARMIESAGDLLGPNIMLWRSQLFIQDGSEETSIPWHRDTYDNILADSDKQVSVQLALTDTTPGNCLQLIPGTHLLNEDQLYTKFGLQVHTRNMKAGNTKFRYKGEAPPTYSAVLRPGQYVIFHPKIIHRSSLAPRDTIAKERICLTARFATPDVEVRKLGAKVRCVLLIGSSPQNINDIEDWTQKIH